MVISSHNDMLLLSALAIIEFNFNTQIPPNKRQNNTAKT